MHKETSPLISILYIVYFEFLVYNVFNGAGNMQIFLNRRLLFPTNYICMSKESLFPMATKSTKNT